MPTVSAFLRARYLMPRPLVAPTRMRCITPSGMIASGSPLSTENSSTRPTQRLPGAAGTFSRTTVLPRLGNVTMSELMRIAPMPSLGQTPSIDLRP